MTILRMYAIVRNDLDMSSGKCASQAGHAFVGAFNNTKLERQILYQNGTKVCLGASREQILDIAEQCKTNDIPYYVVIDSGHIMLPHFTGDPIITAIGIGPSYRADVDFLTALELIG